MLDLKQPLGFLHGNGRIGFLVLEQQHHLAAADSAGAVDLLRSQFKTPAHRLADSRIRSRQRRYDAYLDRLLRKGLRRGAQCEK